MAGLAPLAAAVGAPAMLLLAPLAAVVGAPAVLGPLAVAQGVATEADPLPLRAALRAAQTNQRLQTAEQRRLRAPLG